MTGIRRTKCPLCGGRIVVSILYQISHDYRMTKSGRISKNYTVSDGGPEDAEIANCSCGANWGCGEFEVTPEGYFMDYKYGKEGN